VVVCYGLRAVVLDGYSDEPAGLGVPPYLDVYSRYVAGAIWSVEHAAEVLYFTVDQARADFSRFAKAASRADLLVVVAGVCVPGKYLGGEPIRLEELKAWSKLIRGPVKVLGGPAAKFGFGIEGGRVAKLPSEASEGFDLVATGDVEAVVYRLLQENLRAEAVDPGEERPSQGFIAELAVRGAKLVVQHPCYRRNLICEIETYRGCPRAVVGGCSFCIEPLRGLPQFREPRDVVREVEALYKAGVEFIRLGRQPDFFTYMARGVGDLEFPEPRPEEIEKLLAGIRAVAPGLRTLHIDNVNPGTVYHHPEESRRIAKILLKYHTPGDVAAYGIESADPRVVKLNNLKVMPDEAFEAIRLLNEVGAVRGWNGLPHLLPGVNFVYGLIGETKETYRLNLEFMKRVLEEGLMVRRINLRQVMAFPGTRMWSYGDQVIRRHRRLFQAHKLRMRREVDLPMLRRVVPAWTILREVYVEKAGRNLTYARQVGAYPILVCCREKLELGRFMDFTVVAHGYRSVTGIPHPLDLNKASRRLLEDIPLIGRRRAYRIAARRPIRSLSELAEALGSRKAAEKLKPYIKL